MARLLVELGVRDRHWAMSTEPRRYRPGLDYTLAWGANAQPSEKADVTWTCVGGSSESWSTGEVGGSDTWLQSSGPVGADTAAVYDAAGPADDMVCLPPRHNELTIVLRAPGTLRFRKFVSSYAPGSVWIIE